MGAYDAPDLIRKQLTSLPIHHETSLTDLGNIQCNNRDLEAAQEQLGEKVFTLLQKQRIPIVIGGGHEVAYGSFQGVAKYASKTGTKIGIINFDAHFDLRDSTQSTSGTPFYQAYQLSNQSKLEFHYFCLGVARHANTKFLFERARQLGVKYLMDYEIETSNLNNIKDQLDQFINSLDYIYISIDLDVFPLSQAPGVSAPAVFGVDYKIISQLLKHLIKTNKVLLLEIAEYNPLFDKDAHTARLAAHIIYEFIHGSS